ncbi:hypothetical protein [Paenibacillus odorifer]|uniref:hypothetical protein n=1 Tax=Paenibacillus odorifer TaxID=189426 RepID=UPI00096DDB07|nr:hypothetical protein [Paenibacillus odorifer]OME59493.1 hypothetical protein BSK61_06085 [Paenibacillus odorifer]
MSIGGANQGGGGVDVMPMHRLEDVEKGLLGLSSEFARISADLANTNAKMNLLEAAGLRHEESILQMEKSTIKMEVKFGEIMGKFDSLENKIFMLLQQANKDSGSERKMWLDFVKYIIGITIGVIVANQFLGR